jgi:hypothetical protein
MTVKTRRAEFCCDGCYCIASRRRADLFVPPNISFGKLGADECGTVQRLLPLEESGVSLTADFRPHLRIANLRIEKHYLNEWLDSLEYFDVKVEWASAKRQYQSPPRQTWRDLRTEAFTTLHVLPSAPVELVAAAKKVLNTKYHPDRPDGDLRLCQEVNAAADLLMREAA